MRKSRNYGDSAPERIRICEFDENGSGNVIVDELGIWSKALTDTEVSELYNNGAGSFYEPNHEATELKKKEF